MKRLLAIAAVALLAATAFAQDISLGKPPATLGIDVLDVPKADLAAILWAGNGLKTADAVSSASKAGATIAVSGDVDYVTVYVLTAKGVYRYEPASDLLKQLSKKDARADVTQENIPTAALMVLFAYDSAKLPSFFKGNPALGRDVAMGSAAFSAQNIQLVAAGLKLSSVVMYNLKPAAAAAAGLSKTESLLFLTRSSRTGGGVNSRG